VTVLGTRASPSRWPVPSPASGTRSPLASRPASVCQAPGDPVMLTGSARRRCEIEVALGSLTLFGNYVDSVRTADDGGFLFCTGGCCATSGLVRALHCRLQATCCSGSRGGVCYVAAPEAPFVHCSDLNVAGPAASAFAVATLVLSRLHSKGSGAAPGAIHIAKSGGVIASNFPSGSTARRRWRYGTVTLRFGAGFCAKCAQPAAGLLVDAGSVTSLAESAFA
jgi:hypothetical protein